jgi:hypothetical protein
MDFHTAQTTVEDRIMYTLYVSCQCCKGSMDSTHPQYYSLRQLEADEPNLP